MEATKALKIENSICDSNLAHPLFTLSIYHLTLIFSPVHRPRRRMGGENCLERDFRLNALHRRPKLHSLFFICFGFRHSFSTLPASIQLRRNFEGSDL